MTTSDYSIEKNEGPSFVERLGEAISSRASARTVYGEPVERDGVTVIPVARVRYGFGGGSGVTDRIEGEAKPKRPPGSGVGGGGGGQVWPIGYIRISGGTAEFCEIPDRGRSLALLVGAGFSTWLVLRGVRSLLAAGQRRRR